MRNAIFILTSLLAVGICRARTITVDDDGPADFNNIQAAIDLATDGDTVEIQPGRYTGPGNRDIDFKGKPITVRSTDPTDPNTVADTIIDCNEMGRGFYFRSGEGNTSVLAGLTIRNGIFSSGGAIHCSGSSPTLVNCTLSYNSTSGFSGRGGAMSIYNGSEPTVVGCTFKDNTASEFGGAICIWDASPVLSHCDFTQNSAKRNGGAVAIVNDGSASLTACTFTENFAPFGGGVANKWSRPILAGCTFRANSALDGGGMHNYATSSPTLTECVFNENSAERWGGGMYNYPWSSPSLTNCIFIRNLASSRYHGEGGGMCNETDSSPTLTNCTFTENAAAFYGGGMYDSHSTPTINNCIFWANTARFGDEIWWGHVSGTVSYSVIKGGWAGEGNIDADPSFVDPNNGDYHLKSQAGRWDPGSESWIQDAVTSPGIDGGDMTDPIGLEPFPNGGIINMGAYGGTTQASKSYFGGPVCETIVAGDINGDCIVDFRDFLFIGLHWMEGNN